MFFNFAKWLKFFKGENFFLENWFNKQTSDKHRIILLYELESFRKLGGTAISTSLWNFQTIIKKWNWKQFGARSISSWLRGSRGYFCSTQEFIQEPGQFFALNWKVYIIFSWSKRIHTILSLKRDFWATEPETDVALKLLETFCKLNFALASSYYATFIRSVKFLNLISNSAPIQNQHSHEKPEKLRLRAPQFVPEIPSPPPPPSRRFFVFCISRRRMSRPVQTIQNSRFITFKMNLIKWRHIQGGSLMGGEGEIYS